MTWLGDYMKDIAAKLMGQTTKDSVVYVVDRRGKKQRHTIKSFEELYQLFKEVKEMDNLAQLSKHGKMEVLDQQGHTEITWDSHNEQEVATARATFDAMIGQGYQAFRPGTSKGERGNRITTFDPMIEAMVLFPQLRGG